MNTLKKHSEMASHRASWQSKSASTTLEIEKAYLEELGARLGTCAEKLLALGLEDARRIDRSISSDQSFVDLMDVSYFASALKPALEHTSAEMSGVGCLPAEAKEISKVIAESLSSEINALEGALIR